MTTSLDLSKIRTDYKQASLDERDADSDPFVMFGRWMDDAVKAEALEPTAMTLSTLGADGAPDARIVLLKGADASGFVFYTNYDSAKGREIIADPRVSLVFFWAEVERQVRVVGRAEKTSLAQSESYFASRPRKSKLGALASQQSQVVASRDVLETQFADADAKYPGDDVPRPGSWGGFRVVPTRIELWQGRRSRLHDRLRYTRQDAQSSIWTRVRLAP